MDLDLNYEDYDININIKPVSGYQDYDGDIKFNSGRISSSNFDGMIPLTTASLNVINLQPGYLLQVDSPAASISGFYQIYRIDRQDPGFSGSAYTGFHTIYYLNGDRVFSSSFTS
jgi:hypothetical protein